MGYIRRMPVTAVLVAVNIFIFICLELAGSTNDSHFMLVHGAMSPGIVLYSGQWYRLLTSVFVHFGMEHLLNNMLLLVVLGQYLESAVGAVRFMAIYLFSGISGAFASLVFMLMRGENNIAGGASGGIFGILGGLIVVVLVHKGRYRNFRTRSILFVIALALYGGFTSAEVDNAAHVGGLVAGILFTFIIYGIRTIITLKKLREYDRESAGAEAGGNLQDG